MRTTNPRNLGFNLIELAIALGVAGLVLAGLFLAYQAVVDSNRVNNAHRQVLDIAQSVRNFYPGARPLETGTYTQSLLNARALPNDVINGATTRNPWGTTSALSELPNGGVSVGAGISWGNGCFAAGRGGPNVILVTFWGLPQGGAGKLMAKFTGPQAGTAVTCLYCDRVGAGAGGLGVFPNPRTTTPDQVGSCRGNVVFYIQK